MHAKGKCPQCHSTVVGLQKTPDGVKIVVKCTCAEHPDDCVTFDLNRMLQTLETDVEDAVVYVHKGNDIVR